MKIGKTSAKAIIDSVKCINYLSSYSNQSITEKKIIDYLKMSAQYVKDALDSSILVGFVHDDQSFSLTELGKTISTASNEQQWLIFQSAILQFSPITPLLKLLNESGNIDDAVRKVISIFEIEGNFTRILHTFKSWLRFSRIIDSSGNYSGENVSVSLPNNYINEIINALKDSISLRLFIDNFFTSSVFSQIPSRTINLIVRSFQIYQSTPDLSIVSIGKALESYIRNLPIMLNISFRFNPRATLGALVAEIQNNLHLFPIDEKHIRLLHGILQPRNMSAHESNEPFWDIKEESAITTILFYLSVIRSIHVLVFSQSRIF